MTFQVGDVVVLKSGGPAMTVQGTYYNATEGLDKVQCIWFDEEDHRVHNATFPVAALKPVK